MVMLEAFRSSREQNKLSTIATRPDFSSILPTPAEKCVSHYKKYLGEDRDQFVSGTAWRMHVKDLLFGVHGLLQEY